MVYWKAVFWQTKRRQFPNVLMCWRTVYRYSNGGLRIFRIQLHWRLGFDCHRVRNGLVGVQRVHPSVRGVGGGGAGTGSGAERSLTLATFHDGEFLPAFFLESNGELRARAIERVWLTLCLFLTLSSIGYCSQLSASHTHCLVSLLAQESEL